MIIVPAHVKIKTFGFKMCSKNKLTLNGCLFIPNYVLGVKKQSKEVPAVILWHVFVARVSVISVQGLGNPITKIILSAIFSKKVQLRT